jgi:two-component system phosphate regulon sensor histidine kinase PhoR
VPISIYVGEPLRAVLFLACGLVAGVAANLAWRGGIRRENANAMTGISTIADKVLSWKDIATAMPDPAIVLDRSSVILNYNAAARSLFDRLRTGLPLEHVNRDPELIAAVSSALANGEKRIAHLGPRGGAGQRLIATVTPFGGSDRHSPVAILISIHDQSEQHRLLEMRSDFIANASHELRTPLASVRGFIETLQGPARDDEAARERFLAIMADQAERMTRLIDDLLLLSRVEEKVNLKPTGHVDLSKVIDDVVRSLTPAANERNMTIIVEPSAGPLLAMGDRVPQEGAFIDQATVTVADDGPGIAPDHLPRLTERFYRVSNEHSRRIGGTGLGLAIVKHVLNRHEGELQIKSVVGAGTTFTVTLPAC